MTTVPTIPSFTAGSTDTAAKLQALADMQTFHENPPYCDVSNAAGVACTTATATLLTWDTENEDTDGMHNTSSNTSRILLNTIGLYEVRYFVRWPTGMTGNIVVNLRLNSGGVASGGSSLRTTNEAANTSGTTETERCINYRPTSPGTDYLEVFVTQSAGSTKTTTGGARVTGMQVRRITG